MRVMAHTSKLGFHSLTQNVPFEASYRSYGKWTNWAPYEKLGCVVAYSNRGPTIKSDGRKPTNYYRKVGRLIGQSWQQGTNSHRQRGNDGRAYIGLASIPHGSAYSNPGVTIPDWMTNFVIQSCMTELLELRAMIMEDIAQANSTLKQLVGIFSTIVKLTALALKGRWRAVRRTLRGLGYRPTKKLANAWLGFYYGIRPLVSTMQAICENYEDKHHIVSANRKIQTAVDVKNFVVGTNLSTSGEAYQRVKCGLTVAVNASGSFRYWKSLGFTSMFANDALLLAWALTPYSFVVDWILPVERFIQTRTFVSLLDFQHGYISKSLVCDAKAFGDCVGIGVGVKSQPGPEVKVKCIQFQRLAYGFAPPTGLAVNQTLNPINLINAAALLIQRRKN